MNHKEIKILLVEDDEADVLILAETLVQTSLKFKIKNANNLSNAVELIRSEKFDILLLDLGLPESQGPETFDRISKIAENIPIIVLTGLKDLEIGINLVKKGAQDYLVKGDFDCKLLERAIVYSIERKKIEEALIESEVKYRELVENANSIIAKFDNDGTILSMNEFGLKFFGYTKEELVGKKWQDTCIPRMDSTGKRLETLISDIYQDIENYAVNINENIKSNGELVWVYWTNKPIMNENGNVTSLLSIGTDITARKKAEDDLRERVKEINCLYDIAKINEIPNITLDQLFQKIVERMPYGWKYTEIACARIKFEGQEFKTINFTETIWKQEAQINVHEKNVGMLEVFYLEKRPDLDEGPFLTEEKNLIMALAERLGLILERKYSEQALIESENTLQSIFAAAPVGIYLIKDRVFQWANNKMSEILGYPKEEIIGQNTRILYATEEEYERVGKLLYPETLIDNVNVESRLRRKDGTILDCYIGLSPLDPLDHSKGCITTLMDITDRKKAEDKLKIYQTHLEDLVAERTKKLESLNKELEAFSYSVSHDLRSPLRAIDGFGQVLMEECSDKLDDDGQHYIERMRAAAAKMGNLIDDMLKLSRIARTELKKEDVNISQIIEEIIADFEESNPNRKVKFIIKKGVIVKGDSALLKLMIENLLSNAWKFTSKKDEAVIEFGVTTEKDICIYFIKDNGAGFDMEYTEKLFTPFHRLHSESEFPGTGIGLANVKRIVTMHGGEIWAEAKVGQGAAFYFII